MRRVTQVERGVTTPPSNASAGFDSFGQSCYDLVRWHVLIITLLLALVRIATE
jgi:hypothetical protein